MLTCKSIIRFQRLQMAWTSHYGACPNINQSGLTLTGSSVDAHVPSIQHVLVSVVWHHVDEPYFKRGRRKLCGL
jgi:hypothetical protein